MADGKPDLPENLLLPKPSGRSWTGKVEALGGADEKVDESKDQISSENIPLSPQWLYAKPSDSKLDSRFPPPDPNQKEAWRLDGSQDKKDWRRIVTENESSRRWREEERETGLLSGRRDRRKGERPNVASREATENKAMPSPDRWHDGNIRNPGHESRRDNKWSSRWGPEEKEKESHTSEKRMDAEKEKDDALKENQSFVSNNRPISDRDPDSSRDKWRPRHRMDIHSGGSTAFRAAPGFGLDRGKAESHNVGFAVGRGRATFMGRSSSAGLIGVHSLKDESISGKPKVATATFCYPRGKLLDIYRSQKFDNTSFIPIPDGMEEEPPITQADLVEPLAFVAPGAEEEGVLYDIWRGKITSSGVADNSFKQGRTSENVSEPVESTEKKQGMLSHILSGGTIDTLKEAADDDACIASLAGKEVASEVASEGGFNVSSTTLPSMDDGSEDLTSFGRKGRFPDDSSSFHLSSSDENHRSHGQQVESSMEAKSLRAAPEELTLFYVDPLGNMQGPFLGADIISWFRQGFFGTDLLVRVGDSSDGAPFQELGTIMPHLKVEDTQANVDDQTFMLEHSNSLGGELEAVHTSSSILTSIDPSTRNLFHASPEFNGITAQHAQSSIPEHEAKLRFQQSESQRFEDNVAQDEEIVFPGRSGNAYSIVESSWSIHSPIVNSSSHHSLPNELTETGIPNENDNKLHRFGLLWSELEDAQMRQTQSSNIPSGVVRSSTFSGMVDSGLAGETWSDIYGKRTFPESDMYRDALTAARLSRMDHESNHFDLTDQLLSQQLRQKQLQQQNIVSPHAGLNESLLEHLSSQNLNHQRQLSNQSVPDLEHLVALQMQQQWQLELQQQQFHQEQKLLQERQQSQAQQALLEQFLHGQVQAPGLGLSHAEAIRSNNALDQVLLEQQLLRKLQHQSHHASRNFAPSLDQLVQAKFGQAGHQENQRDLYEIIARAQQGKMQSLDHQLLQEEQLHKQFSLGLKRHNEERDLGSMWPADQPNQFLRNSAGINRVNSSGFSPLDLYHQQQMSSHEEQLSHLERNFSLRNQLQQGLYDHSSSPFERSMSMPGGASGINMEVMNAIAHARGFGIDEPNMHLQSAGQVGTFSSGLRTHNPHRLVSNQYDAPQHAIEGHWAESNGKMENDWMENRIQQLQINAERQNRDLAAKMPSENSSSWMSDGLSEDKSRQLLMDLLHQKPGHQSTVDSLERVPSGIFPGSLDRPFSVHAEQDAGLNSTFSVGSYGSSSSERQQIYLADEPGLDSNDRSQFRHGSGFVTEGERFLSHASDNAQATYRDADMSGLLSMKNELSDGTFKQGGWTSVGERDIPVNILSRHPSLGVTGGNAGSYNDQIGLMNSYIKESTKDRVQVPVKAQENMLLRRPPVHASLSKEGSLEFASDPAGRVKNSSSGNDGVKRDPESSDTMAKKDMRFRRTSSYGEGDLSEASFIDMLKSNSKKSAVPEPHGTTGAESSDAAQGGKGGKKKGKKGRQIDPALLGFKVTSNRILMGEIQRADD